MGTKIRYQYTDNAGEQKTATGHMLTIVPIDVREADGTLTGTTIPMAVIGNKLGTNVRLVRTDELQTV
jgi:hypothetical protein